MALNQSLGLRLDQKLVMTPQLQLAIKLLQMPTLDLQGFIGQELMDNPFLANDDGTTEEVNDTTESTSEIVDSAQALESDSMGAEKDSLDMGWDSMYDSGTSTSGGSSSSFEDDDQSLEKSLSHEISLKDYLQQQVGEVTDDPKLHFLCNYLIDSIDDAGYIRANLANVATRLSVSLDVIEDALELLQTLDPAGVGARTLKECLTLQLELDVKLKGDRLEKASKVIAHLELLAQKNFKKLAKAAGCTLEELTEYCKLITTLTPKPGLKFGSDVSTNVIPDVNIMKKEGVWRSELNAEAMPKILLNSGYQTQMAGRSGEEKGYVNERVSRAQWLIKSLEQRAKTIFKVSNAIVQYQVNFFDMGIESLQPMTLKMIAERVGVHESTVSRVTNGKYMQTPMGVFEMKYFFSSAIGTTGGNTTVASASVRQIIKRLIAEESTEKPLSDEKLVQLLKTEGVDVARRTVAKYREGLGIPSSSGRRIRA
ncbi:MAG: RNA polymerase sigma-54 factor [Alphaproteobacteria bacterium]|jgi:RNA polymerase sigma-54 factor